MKSLLSGVLVPEFRNEKEVNISIEHWAYPTPKPGKKVLVIRRMDEVICVEISNRAWVQLSTVFKMTSDHFTTEKGGPL